MFSHFQNGSPHCASYDTALMIFDRCSKTPTGRQRKAQDAGVPLVDNGRSRWVRKDAAGSIRFRLYNTDVVIYHADGSVTLDPHPSVTTSTFSWPLTPGGLTLAADGTITVNGHDDGFICKGREVTFKRDAPGRLWRVASGELMSFTDSKVDTIALRAAKVAHNLFDFKGWLEMALIHKGARAHNNNHRGWRRDDTFGRQDTRDEFYQALADKQLLAALELVPYLSDKSRNSFGRNIEGFGADAVDWARIDLCLAQRIGAISFEERTQIPVKAYRTMLKRAKQMQNKSIPGCWNMGW